MEFLEPIDNIDVINSVKRLDLMLVHISDGFLCLVDDNGQVMEDIKVPENNLGLELHRRCEQGEKTMVTVIWSASGEKAAVGIKPLPEFGPVPDPGVGEYLGK